ncbi:MAG: deoxyguanosinetriphosphate triphosphohydrolase [Firmicutes bacterium]|nr:deoxyguanosinetriphosphate triphosphohydrolase [Bacillota bacterium]
MRRYLESLEEQTLSPLACKSRQSQGRRWPEEECDLRTAFQRDRDRILHSKAFRRLKHKTQVFIAPEGDHYRTRLTHTLEVAQIARTVARALRLNEDLTEAIALGHDLGHTPFGHAGEAAMSRMIPAGFRHNEQSLRVVERLEHHDPRFPGLNLTWEVRDGILHHTGPGLPATLEGQIVRLADRIAYINHDIDDAVRAGLLQPQDLPPGPVGLLGPSGSARINTLVRDLVKASWEQEVIRLSPEVGEAMDDLRSFLFQRVYVGSLAKAEEAKVAGVLRSLFSYYVDHPGEMPPEPAEWQGKVEPEPVERRAVDFIAGMTDRFAIRQYMRIFVPSGWQGLNVD